MGAVARSAVTVHETWKGLGTSNRRFLFKEVTIALSSQGDLTDSVGASLFGLRKIVGAMNFRDSSSVALAAVPSYDGLKLAFYAAETAGTPANATATVKGIVFGNE